MIRLIALKDLRVLFVSPLAWGVYAVVSLVLAWLFLTQLDQYMTMQAQLATLSPPPGVTELVIAPLSAAAALLALMLTPLFAMRALSEERRLRTLPLLLSSPVSETQIVLGKFFGLWIILLPVAGLVALMAASLALGTQPDWGLLLANLIGLLLLLAAFAAVGVYASGLSAHPLLAAVIALGLLLGLWLVDNAASSPDGVLRQLSLSAHFSLFNRGVLDSADVAYFVVLIALFLSLAVLRLKRQRTGGH